MRFHCFILIINLWLLIAQTRGYSVKKVIDNELGKTDYIADDEKLVEITTSQPSNPNPNAKSEDVNSQGIVSSSDDADTSNDEVTTEAQVIAAADDVTNVNEKKIDPSLKECSPDYASFGDCIREMIPADPEVEDIQKISEPTAEDNNSFLKLVQDANLTISESPSNHRYFQGRANCKCGVSSQRIVGGLLTTIREHPWMVALVRNGVWGGGRAYCGGTLINSRYVITASHCVDGQTASGIAVVLNEQDFDSGSETVTERYSVSQITMHPQYNRRNIDNDIALLKLSRPVSLIPNGPIIPACLPASNSNSFAGVTATVTGWGATSAGGSTSSKLRKVDVPVLSNEECNTNTKYNGKITQNMLCAGLINSGGKDSCQGDSGGPLTINNGGRRTLIGIVSWGYGCAQPQSPGVYNRVARYPDWILANTRDADWCEG